MNNQLHSQPSTESKKGTRTMRQPALLFLSCLLLASTTILAEDVITMGYGEGAPGDSGVHVIITARNESPIHGYSIAFTYPADILSLRTISTAGTNIQDIEADFVAPSLDNQLDGKVVECEIDKANLTRDGRRVLDSVVAILRTNPGRVEISGHTDTTGQMDHNLELSQRRAETVQSYFVAKGFKADRFEIVGHGPTRPIASNATPEGQQMNRRTEFHALKEN